MLCIGSGFAGPELDLPAALRITDSLWAMMAHGEAWRGPTPATA